MKALSEFQASNPPIKVLFTDIDDTLTNQGRLEPKAYNALWQLQEHGIKIVPITGRPAGWCEMIARFWPVDGIIGENGAFYFRYENQTMNRWYAKSENERSKDQIKLNAIKEKILKDIPGAAIASDQFCRLADLAIDFCEDVPALSKKDIAKIVTHFTESGAQAKVSSIHVNGWFGDYNKLTTAKIFAKSVYGYSDEDMKENCAFTGDSPNDEPMFSFFPMSFGVKNVEDFILESPPSYIATQRGGDGFAEITDVLIRS